MADVFIASNVFLTAFSISWNVVMGCLIEGTWVVPLAPTVITMSDSTFHF